jgi:hypothetical protein
MTCGFGRIGTGNWWRPQDVAGPDAAPDGEGNSLMSDSLGGYQPPGGAGGPSSPGSTTETAKHQAAGVASTTAEQARNVAGEAQAQARNLMTESRSQINQQAAAQKDKASGGLRGLATELRSMADQGQQSGIASDLARQAADKAQELAGWLDGREPGDLLNDVRDLARRRPGTFLLGAAAAGVLAGRLTRSAVDIKRDDGDQIAGRGKHSIDDYPVSAGSEWTTGAGGTAAGEPLEGLAVERESTPLAAEAYAATGQGTGNDRL